jgi:hypothetical protein
MRFRFTIRDLLWLTLVVALAVGWRLSLSRWQNDLRTEMDKRYKAEADAVYWRHEYGSTHD